MPPSNNSRRESLIRSNGRGASNELSPSPARSVSSPYPRSEAEARNATPSSSMNWRDIVLMILNHKWAILLFTLLGLAAAAAVYMQQEPNYRSTAKLMVRYIIQRGALDPFEAEQRTEGSAAERLLNGEIQILQSLDTARTAAKEFGPEQLVPEETPEELALESAAGQITAGLNAGVVWNTNVLEVTYDHEDRELSKGVLETVVANYLQRHLEIHRSFGATKAIRERIAQVREQLSKTETQLHALKSQEGIISLEGSSSSLEEQRAMIASEILSAETALAEQEARSGVFNAHEAEVEAALLAHTGSTALDQPIPSTVVLEYGELVEQLRRKTETRERRLETYTENDYVVVKLAREIGRIKQQRQQLVASYPALLTSPSSDTGISVDTKLSPSDLQEAQLLAARARLAKVKEHSKELETEFSQWTSISSKIAELERQRALQESNYELLEKNLEKATVDQTLDSSQLTNIHVLQNPSNAVPVYDDLTKKLILGLAGSGLALGLGFAFLMEFFVDRRVKAPGELRSRLNVPLLLSIPELQLPMTRAQGRSKAGNRKALSTDVDFPVAAATRDSLRPWAEAMRNRLIFGYEVNQLHHKPKLIGVSAAAEAAGATTIASALADAFSEIEDAKVLYISLSEESQIRAWETRNALTLQSAQTGGPQEGEEESHQVTFKPVKLPPARRSARNNRPLQLMSMLPQLQDSDYDYVIFDMPSLQETSPTFAMAGMMDQLILVLDAQNTSRDTLKRYYAELEEANANVSCVFNKTKSKGPAWLIE